MALLMKRLYLVRHAPLADDKIIRIKDDSFPLIHALAEYISQHEHGKLAVLTSPRKEAYDTASALTKRIKKTGKDLALGLPRGLLDFDPYKGYVPSESPFPCFELSQHTINLEGSMPLEELRQTLPFFEAQYQSFNLRFKAGELSREDAIEGLYSQMLRFCTLLRRDATLAARVVNSVKDSVDALVLVTHAQIIYDAIIPLKPEGAEVPMHGHYPHFTLNRLDCMVLDYESIAKSSKIIRITSKLVYAVAPYTSKTTD